MHYTALHYTALSYTTLHHMRLYYTILDCTSLNYTALCDTAKCCLNCTELHRNALHCNTLHCPALPCITLCYFSLPLKHMKFKEFFQIVLTSYQSAYFSCFAFKSKTKMPHILKKIAQACNLKTSVFRSSVLHSTICCTKLKC